LVSSCYDALVKSNLEEERSNQALEPMPTEMQFNP